MIWWTLQVRKSRLKSLIWVLPTVLSRGLHSILCGYRSLFDLYVKERWVEESFLSECNKLLFAMCLGSGKKIMPYSQIWTFFLRYILIDFYLYMILYKKSCFLMLVLLWKEGISDLFPFLLLVSCRSPPLVLSNVVSLFSVLAKEAFFICYHLF